MKKKNILHILKIWGIYLANMRGKKQTFRLQWTVMANWTCASGLSISVLGKVLAIEMAM